MFIRSMESVLIFYKGNYIYSSINLNNFEIKKIWKIDEAVLI